MFGQRVLALAEASSPPAAILVKVLFIPVLFALTYLLARVSWATVEELFCDSKIAFRSLNDRCYPSDIVAADSSHCRECDRD
jgi:hypothetical protein